MENLAHKTNELSNQFQCMAATMDLDSSAITGLSVEINEAIGSVTDVDKILTETSDDIAKADQLKADADRSKAEATAQLEHARKVGGSCPHPHYNTG